MVIPELSETEWCWLEDGVMVLMDAIEKNAPPNDCSEIPELRALLAKINKMTGSYLPSGTLP